MITYYLGRKHVRADLPMAVSNASRYRGRRRGMDDDTLVRRAEASLKRPPDFGYYGNYPLFWSWGMVPLAQTRDSEALDRSNYRRILEDARKIAPDEDMGGSFMYERVSDFRSSHWGFGWAEQIICRVLYDPEEDITAANITAPFRMIMQIVEYLASDYPVYDEADLSELEHEEASAEFDSEWAWMVRRWDEDDGPEPSDAEKEHIWSAYELAYDDNRKDADSLEGYVLAERRERTAAARAAVGDKCGEWEVK